MMNKKQIIPSGNAHNLIASGTVIKGNIAAQEDFRIDGTVEGNIECRGKVVVGPSGEVFGQIDCINAELMGKVHGNIKTSETLVLKGGSNYQGELKVKVLEIESGAVFNGTCKMTNGLNESSSENIQFKKSEVEK